MSDPAVDPRVWVRTSHLTLAAAAAVGLVTPEALRGDLRHAPLLLSLLLFGMAHGAVDHHVSRRLGSGPRVGPFVVAYTLAAFVAGGLWLIDVRLGLAAFLTVSLLHWGQGDLWFAVATGRGTPRTRPRLAAFVLAHGSLPIALSALAHPAEAADVSTTIAQLFDDAVTIAPVDGTVRTLGFVLVALAVLAAVASARADAGGWTTAVRREGAELVGLGVFFLVVPATFAVGVYFLAWHAPRHVVRLMATDPDQRALLEAGRPVRAAVAFHREALPLTLVALAGCAALAVLAGSSSGGRDIVAVALAVIAGLTWPHAAVVTWMDRAAGLGPRPVAPV